MKRRDFIIEFRSMFFRDEKDVSMHEISYLFLRDVKKIYLCKEFQICFQIENKRSFYTKEFQINFCRDENKRNVYTK